MNLLIVFVAKAKASFISFNHGFDTLSNCEGCLILPSEAGPTPTLQRVDDIFGKATVRKAHL